MAASERNSALTTHATARNRQSGQMLIASLFFVAIGLASMLYLFDIGQLVVAKTRLTNAADASAYSAAAWRARVLNYAAYSNRAIVAQEVAIAQAVTLESWSRYVETLTRNVQRIAQIFPPAAAVMEVVAQIAEYTRELTEYTAAGDIRLRDAPFIGYKTMLIESQRIMLYAGGTFAAGAVATEVVKANDRRFSAFALGGARGWKNFTHRYRSRQERKRLRRVVVRSLDPFTGGPRGVDQSLYVPNGCISSSLWQTFVKRGGTALTPDLVRWEAADTASVQGYFRKRRRCRRVEILPLGWGASEVSSVGATRNIVGNPGGVRDNPKSFEEADDQLGNHQGADHVMTGIAKVFDLNYSALSNKKYPRSRVTVLASMRETKMRWASTVGIGNARLSPQHRLPGDRIWALASAEVYFRRSPKSPRRIEYASLYNPYWQVRLVQSTPAERIKAATYENR